MCEIIAFARLVIRHCRVQGIKLPGAQSAILILSFLFCFQVFDKYEFTINTDTEDVLLAVCDASENEGYDRLRPLSYPLTDVVLIWFDVTNEASYENVLQRVRAVSLSFVLDGMLRGACKCIHHVHDH